MAKGMLLPLLLASGLAFAEPPTADEDGFTHPLRNLEFNPGLDQREFERATFQALDVYDPFESMNRRIYHFNYRPMRLRLLHHRAADSHVACTVRRRQPDSAGTTGQPLRP